MRMWFKDAKLVNDIINLNHESFSGVEQAPPGVVRGVIHEPETAIFAAATYDGLMGAAVVTEKFGEPYVWSIAVRQSSRGQGVASALLDEIACYAREKGAEGTVLICNSKNATAQRVYLAAGYLVTKFLPRYYGNDGDGLLMRRKI